MAGEMTDGPQMDGYRRSNIILDVHFLCFISNAVLDRPVDNSQNFDGVAYIA